MSREERRQYQRLMKGMDPTAPPAPRGAGRRRVERARQRRARSVEEAEPRRLTARYVVVSLVIAFLVGLIALSLAWPNGPSFALAVGVGAGVVFLGLLLGLRLFQQRAATR